MVKMLKFLSASAVLLLVCWIVTGTEEIIRPRKWKCQYIPVLKTLDSQLHPGCTVQFLTFICGGYCEMLHFPSRVRRKEDESGSEPVYQVHMKKECSCCVPTAFDELTQNRTTVMCGGQITNLTEPIITKFVTSCDCLGCKSTQPGLLDL